MTIAALASSGMQCPKDHPLPWGQRKVVLDGETFRMLGRKEIEESIVGTWIQFSNDRAIPPWTHRFEKGGHAVDYGDRMDIDGRYRISGDSIRIKWEFGNSERLAFFRSADGDMAVGSYHYLGCMWVKRIEVHA